jgi:hypothetical protein
MLRNSDTVGVLFLAAGGCSVVYSPFGNLDDLFLLLQLLLLKFLGFFGIFLFFLIDFWFLLFFL